MYHCIVGEWINSPVFFSSLTDDRISSTPSLMLSSYPIVVGIWMVALAISRLWFTGVRVQCTYLKWVEEMGSGIGWYIECRNSPLWRYASALINTAEISEDVVPRFVKEVEGNVTTLVIPMESSNVKWLGINESHRAEIMFSRPPVWFRKSRSNHNNCARWEPGHVPDMIPITVAS